MRNQHHRERGLGPAREARRFAAELVVGVVEERSAIDELVARAEAVLRRTSNGAAAANVHECADLMMDDDAHRVLRAGEDVSLSPTEYNLLRYLLVNRGRVVSKAQILDHVWDYDFEGDPNIVEVYIRHLRNKLDRPFERDSIRTFRGAGYRLSDGS